MVWVSDRSSRLKMKNTTEFDQLAPAERARRLWTRNKIFFQRLMRGCGATCMALGFYTGNYYSEYGNDFRSIELALLERGFAKDAFDENFFFVYL